MNAPKRGRTSAVEQEQVTASLRRAKERAYSKPERRGRVAEETSSRAMARRDVQTSPSEYASSLASAALAVLGWAAREAFPPLGDASHQLASTVSLCLITLPRGLP